MTSATGAATAEHAPRTFSVTLKPGADIDVLRRMNDTGIIVLGPDQLRLLADYEGTCPCDQTCTVVIVMGPNWDPAAFFARVGG